VPGKPGRTAWPSRLVPVGTSYSSLSRPFNGLGPEHDMRGYGGAV
jgi:hypothetical protein